MRSRQPRGGKLKHLHTEPVRAVGERQHDVAERPVSGCIPPGLHPFSRQEFRRRRLPRSGLLGLGGPASDHQMLPVIHDHTPRKARLAAAQPIGALEALLFPRQVGDEVLRVQSQ